MRGWRNRCITAILIILALWRLAAAFRSPHEMGLYQSLVVVDSGETFIHAAPSEGKALSWSMPLPPLLCAVLRHHAQPWAARCARAAALLLCLALCFALGRMLHSAPVGAAAALFFALSIPPDLYADRWLYAVFLLLAAYAAAWRAEQPSTWRSLVLGSTVAASFMVLSPLFLFPFLLLALDLRAKRAQAASAVALLAPSVLLLLPWVLMNALVYHRFVLFELGRADTNLAEAALGVVRWIRPPASAAELTGGQSALAWTALQAISHPLSFVWGCVQRLWWSLELHPWLWAAAAAGAWLGRSRPKLRALAVLCGYFLVIHLPLALDERFFHPLLGVLAALAAGGLASLFPAQEASERSAALPLYAVLFPGLALAVFASALAGAYPFRTHPSGPTGDDAWQWAQEGRRLLAADRPEEAAEAYARSLALDPEPDSPAEFALALGPKAVELARRPAINIQETLRARLAGILVSLQAGDAAAAHDFAAAAAGEASSLMIGRGPIAASPEDMVTPRLVELVGLWPLRREGRRALDAFLDATPELPVKRQALRR